MTPIKIGMLIIVSLVLLQLAIKIFNHSQPVFALIPAGIIIAGFYFTINKFLKNEKN